MEWSKTAYLYLRIIENSPFLYQSIGGTVYHVAEKGVEAVQSWSSKGTTVAFVDGDREDFEPKDILLHRSVRLIVASSPKGAYPGWTNQLSPALFVTQLVVKLWSHEEFFLTGIFLHPSDLSLKLLRELTSYFGYNPRRCFQASSSVAILVRGMSILCSCFTRLEQMILTSPIRFFKKSNQYRSKARKANAPADFYYNVSSTPDAAPLRGIRTECTFSIRGLTDSNQMT